jgi:precorrin-6A/cobalt-precorrin-6A reductase
MKLLLLAGSGEARAIADGLAAMAGVEAIASLAGETRRPASLATPSRVGGFGGDAGFRTFLRQEAIDAVLDATHPFAQAISRRTERICREEGVAHCLFQRPAWQAAAGDHWVRLRAAGEAADHVPQGAVVFLATGRKTLAEFANLAGRQLYCRVIDPPKAPFPFAGGRFVVGRPPFTVSEEEALFTRLGIDWLIVKNAGGTASESKLIAARNLGIRVGMIERPPPPDGAQIAGSVEAALAWVASVNK